MERRREIRYFELESPVGRLLVVLSEWGLLRIAFGESTPREIERIAGRLRPRTEPAKVYGEPLEEELRSYFGGKPQSFKIPVDYALVTPFSADVLTALRKVPFGRTTTYGDLAGQVGRPRAARAVGQAVGANPIPIVIPCHRVFASDGTLGGYSGGLHRKKKLLEIEGLAIPPGGWNSSRWKRAQGNSGSRRQSTGR